MSEFIYCDFLENYTVGFKVDSNALEGSLYLNDKLISTSKLKKNCKNHKIKFSINDFDARGIYKVKVLLENGDMVESIVNNISLYNTNYFDKKYTYNGNLGAIYSNEKTSFRLWAPICSRVILRVYESGTPLAIDKEKGNDSILYSIPMEYTQNGVWECDINGDLEGKYYTYIITNYKNENVEVVDPYAKSCGISGRRGMIVDFSKTNPEGWNEVKVIPYKRTEIVVYETHISDITSSSSWTNDIELLKYQKKFKGAYTKGTSYTEGNISVKTGFDHIKELGVNVVQLLPFFDRANDETKMSFNWGYDPLNYNTLEGSYSMNPYDGYERIKEFKDLVKAYNEAGINIIMDVVYNHVFDALKSNFEIITPGYFFRHNKDLSLSNGSGCGNETRSEMPMFRKFMIESTEFLAREYKLFGFRFDLMAVHDYETMNLLVSNLKNKVNENIVVYGEPWVGGDSTLSPKLRASQANGKKFNYYGQFNDKYRDALIMGGVKKDFELGWIDTNKKIKNSELKKIINGIKGYTVGDNSSIYDPNKTVNYVTCHDNHTLFDRFKAVGIFDDSVIKKMAMLSNSMILTSNGTSFILAGEEFLRTKGGDSNSYISSYKVNELDYSLKIKNLDMFKNYQKLIEFKKNVSDLHLTNKELLDNINIVVSKDFNQISYRIKNSSNNREYLVIHNNGYKSDTLPLLDLRGYNLYLSINGSIELKEFTKPLPYQTIIVYKNY